MECTQNEPDLMNRVFNTVASYALFHESERRFAEIELLEKLAEDVALVVRAPTGIYIYMFRRSTGPWGCSFATGIHCDGLLPSSAAI
jgi:hypothetical protein